MTGRPSRRRLARPHARLQRPGPDDLGHVDGDISPLSGTGVAFTYGATGLPVGKTTNTGATSTLVWDTAAANPELLADGPADLLYGPTGRAVEQVDTATTTPTYLVADQLGSTRVLTNQAGTVVGTYSFGPYGGVTSHTGTATSPIGYAGGVETATTGLVNFEHRWLTTGTASWLTVDPMVATTTAPYAYSTDDPVNASDPTGLCTLTSCPPTTPGTATGDTLSAEHTGRITLGCGVAVGRSADGTIDLTMDSRMQ